MFLAGQGIDQGPSVGGGLEVNLPFLLGIAWALVLTDVVTPLLADSEMAGLMADERAVQILLLESPFSEDGLVQRIQEALSRKPNFRSSGRQTARSRVAPFVSVVGIDRVVGNADVVPTKFVDFARARGG